VISTVAALDRETRGEYSLLIEARDLGTPVQQATRQVNCNTHDLFFLFSATGLYILLKFLSTEKKSFNFVSDRA
jgi:hypothetical protein